MAGEDPLTMSANQPHVLLGKGGEVPSAAESTFSSCLL